MSILRDEPRSGRLQTSRNSDTIANVRETVIPGRRLTL